MVLRRDRRDAVALRWQAQRLAPRGQDGLHLAQPMPPAAPRKSSSQSPPAALCRGVVPVGIAAIHPTRAARRIARDGDPIWSAHQRRRGYVKRNDPVAFWPAGRLVIAAIGVKSGEALLASCKPNRAYRPIAYSAGSVRAVGRRAVCRVAARTATLSPGRNVLRANARSCQHAPRSPGSAGCRVVAHVGGGCPRCRACRH